MHTDRNFRVLLTHGILFRFGVQVSSVLIVVPYIADQVGSPGIAVALIVPSFTAGALIGTAIGGQVLRITVTVAGLLGGIALVDAALTALIAVDVAVVPSRFVAYPLLLLCLLIGIVSGSLDVVSPVAMSALMSGRQRSELLLKQSGYTVPRWSSRSRLSLRLASSAIHCRGRTSTCCGSALRPWCFVRQAVSRCKPVGWSWRAHQEAPSTRCAKGAFTYAPIHGCGTFLATQLVFTSVTLSPMFYAIYAAESLSASGDMDDFLVFFGFGMLVGIPLWRLVRARLGMRGMYACSAGISVVAAIICIVSQHWHPFLGLWAFGPVLLLSAIANQVVWPAAYDWVFGHISAEQAVVVISYSKIVVSVGLIFAGFAFSVAAEYGPDIWPLGLLLAATFVACLLASRVPRTVALI